MDHPYIKRSDNYHTLIVDLVVVYVESSLSKGFELNLISYHIETLISCQTENREAGPESKHHKIIQKSPKRLTSKSLRMISSLY